VGSYREFWARCPRHQRGADLTVSDLKALQGTSTTTPVRLHRPRVARRPSYESGRERRQGCVSQRFPVPRCFSLRTAGNSIVFTNAGGAGGSSAVVDCTTAVVGSCGGGKAAAEVVQQLLFWHRQRAVDDGRTPRSATAARCLVEGVWRLPGPCRDNAVAGESGKKAHVDVTQDLIGTTDVNDAAEVGEGGKPFAAYAARALLRVDLHADSDDWAVVNGVKAAESNVEAVLCYGAVVGDDTAVLDGVKAVAAHVDAVLFVNVPAVDDASVVNGVTAVAAHMEAFLFGPAVVDVGAVSKCG